MAGYKSDKKEKTIAETIYNIDTDTGRALVKNFEKELDEFKGHSEEVTQEYFGTKIVTKLLQRDVFLKERGAIVFRPNECGFRVVEGVYMDILAKFKALDDLEKRRKWARENAGVTS